MVPKGSPVIKLVNHRRPFIMAKKEKKTRTQSSHDRRKASDHPAVPSEHDIQNALKDLLGGTIKEMMEAEMDEHLRYEKSRAI